MRGHVGQNPKSGTWFASYDEPRSGDGRRRLKKKGGFATKKEAERFLRQALSEIDRGTYVAPGRSTVGSFLLEDYLPTQAHLRASTLRTYEMYLRLHVVPHVGHLDLAEIRPHHFQLMFSELAGSQLLSSQTVRHVHSIVRRAFNRAVDWGRLPISPLRGIDLRVPPRRSLTTWSPEQVRTFLEAIEDMRDGCLFRVALLTGLRRGELLGLRWVDVRWEQRTIQITQALVEVGSSVTLSPPKTRSSERTVAIDPLTLEALRKHRARQAEERLAWGPGYVDSRLVFTREDGTAYRPSAISRRWLRLQEGLALPRLRLHDARHTHASLALEAGVPLQVVADRLGHSTIALTANTYGHIRPPVAREAADKVAGLIFD
ncbi:site-specific integrase [Acidothermaceae bacterium B102]|nr:site-specific integrase [Acidothermaceae bacterium B102]